MSRIKSNIFANVMGRFWAIVSVYLFVPFYIKYLGIEAYGIIGFYAVLQGIIIIADVGLTATLNREMARLSALNNQENEMRDLVRTIEVLYWLGAILIGLFLQLILDPVIVKFVNPGALNSNEIRNSLSLMIWAIVIQMPATLYQGGLLGLQRQVLSNMIQIAFSLLKNCGALLALIVFSPTLQIYFRWQVISSVLYSTFMAVALYQILGQPKLNTAKFRLKSLGKVWSYATGMALISIISIVFIQLDKIIVVNFVSLKEFAYYSIACVISQVPILLASPISTAIFPVLTAFVVNNDRESTEIYYLRYSQLVSLISISASVTIWLFAQTLILAWTHSADIAVSAAPMVGWFIFGYAIQAIQYIPFQLALANNYVKINIILGISSLVLFLPVMIILVISLGAIGGAIAWAAINLVILIPYIYFLHRKFLPGINRQFYFMSVAMPLAVSITMALVIKSLSLIGNSLSVNMIVIGVSMLLSFLCGALLIPGFSKFFIFPMLKSYWGFKNRDRV